MLAVIYYCKGVTINLWLHASNLGVIYQADGTILACNIVPFPYTVRSDYILPLLQLSTTHIHHCLQGFVLCLLSAYYIVYCHIGSCP